MCKRGYFLFSWTVWKGSHMIILMKLPDMKVLYKRCCFMNFRPGTYHFSSSSEYILPLEYQDSQHMSAHRLVFLYAPFTNCLTFKWKSLGRATVACSCLKASFIPCHRYASEEGWANSREAKQPHCAYMCFVRVPTDWHFNEREGQQKKKKPVFYIT